MTTNRFECVLPERIKRTVLKAKPRKWTLSQKSIIALASLGWLLALASIPFYRASPPSPVPATRVVPETTPAPILRTPRATLVRLPSPPKAILLRLPPKIDP